MKPRFEPDLDFQWQAVDAVCDLFRSVAVRHAKLRRG